MIFLLTNHNNMIHGWQTIKTYNNMPLTQYYDEVLSCMGPSLKWWIQLSLSGIHLLFTAVLIIICYMFIWEVFVGFHWGINTLHDTYIYHLSFRYLLIFKPVSCRVLFGGLLEDRPVYLPGEWKSCISTKRSKNSILVECTEDQYFSNIF